MRQNLLTTHEPATGFPTALHGNGGLGASLFLPSPLCDLGPGQAQAFAPLSYPSWEQRNRSR